VQQFIHAAAAVDHAELQLHDPPDVAAAQRADVVARLRAGVEPLPQALLLLERQLGLSSRLLPRRQRIGAMISVTIDPFLNELA
jgi:hypothetical protein